MLSLLFDPTLFGLLAFYQGADEFDSRNSTTPALLIGGLLVVSIAVLLLFGLGKWEGVRGRQRQIRAEARALGFEYHEADPDAVGKLRFDMFLAGTAFEPSGVVVARRADKRRLLAFDYQLIVEYEIYKAADGSRHRRRSGESNTIGGATIGLETKKLEIRGTAGTTNVDAYLRNVVVLPHGWEFSSKSRLPTSYERHYGPPEFNEKFTVRSDAPDFAERLLTNEMMKFMVSTGATFGFEVRGNQLMIFGADVKPAELPDLARLAGVFHDLIDKDLLDEYPQVAGVDSDGNPQLAPSEADPRPGFPGIESDGSAAGPVLPDRLSAHSTPIVPIIESTPELPAESPEQSREAEPAEPQQPPPEPESIDWSL